MAGDPWAAFDGGAGASPAPAPGGMGGTAPAQQPGGGSDPWAAFDGAPAPAVSSQAGQQPTAAAPDTRKTGMVANAAAGLAEGGTDTLNVLSDPFGNLVGRPLAVLGVTAHDLVAPMFGGQVFTPEQRAFLLNDQVPQPATRAVNALAAATGNPTPDDVRPANALEGVLRTGVRAGTGGALLGASGATTGQVVRSGLANAGVGGTAGVVGEQASEFVPEQYAPAVNLLAGAGTGFGLSAGAAAARNKLADLGRPMNGRDAAPVVAGGAPVVAADGTPLVATPGQLQMAGQQFARRFADPDAARTALAAPVRLVPGSEPTTFQATGDALFGQYERGVARATNEGSAAAVGRADAQNDARVRALQGIAPDTADVGALQAQARAADPAPGGQVRLGQAQGLATQALDAAGGAGLPAGSEGQLGGALRGPVADARAAAKVQESALWNAIDPDGTLQVDMTPIRARARSILRELSPNAAPLSGDEALIMQTATGLPDVQGFRDLAALRQRLTDTIRAGRDDPAQAQAVRRLSMLLDGVHDTMAGAADRADLGAGASAPRPGAGMVPVPAPSVGGEVFTPSGQRVGVRYELVDAGDLVTSHNADMTTNPAFPQELQPRARDRAASEVQVANIASRLQPERLGASSTVADGAPIVGPDGLVESGNGRVLALRRAYQANGPQAQAYRDWLASQGHDTAGMAQPVLVRRRTSDMTPEQRVAFAGEGSTPTTLAMSAPERAAGDARRLSADVLEGVQPGAVTDAANRDFVRGFLRNVVEPGQEGAFVDAAGNLSREGVARVQAALVHRAYGDAGLSAALAETADGTARVLAGAMQDAAGPMARLRAGIEGGHVDPAVDLAPALVEAANVVQQARQRGISLADAVGQRDVFSRLSPRAEGLLRAAYGPELAGRMSREKMAGFLADYAREAELQSTSGNLFGANLTADQLLEGATARYGKATGTDGRGAAVVGRDAPADAGGVRPGLGADGNPGGRLGPGPGGQAAPAGGGGQGGQAGARVLEAPALTPTWDEAAAARYQAARTATATNASTFRNAPGVGEALRSGPTSGSFRMADSEVPAAILTPGTGGANRVRAYIAAGGSEDALNTAAAYMLRRDALRPDGTLDLAKYQAWIKRHGSMLSAMPDVQIRFSTAARAQRAVDEAVVQHAADTRAYQASLAGKLAGDADPVVTVGRALTGASAEADMAQLQRLAAGNPDALAGLQGAVRDFMLRTMQGVQKGVGSEEGRLSGNQLARFVRDREPALRQVLSPEQVDTLKAVVADWERSNLSVAGTKVAGGSDTVQNAGAAVNARPSLLQSLREQAGSAALHGTGAIGGAALGFQHGGTLGAALGGALGAVPGIVTRAVQAARAAGMVTVADLEREAVFNPALARVLLEQPAPAQRAASLGRLVSVLQQASQPPEQRNRQRAVSRPAVAGVPGMRPNALYSPDAVPALRENALARSFPHPH